MSVSKRRSGSAAAAPPLPSNARLQSQQTPSVFFEDIDSDNDHSSSILTDSFRPAKHPLDDLFYHCSQVVSTISSLHETVYGSWKMFLQPVFKSSGSFSRSASLERTWDLFVETIDKCSEPEVQFQLESQLNIYEMPAVGAFSFVRLCQYLVASRFETLDEQAKAEYTILIMGMSRRNRRIKQVILTVWAVGSRRRREQMVRTTVILAYSSITDCFGSKRQ
jgi:hypothetical protein